MNLLAPCACKDSLISRDSSSGKHCRSQTVAPCMQATQPLSAQHLSQEQQTVASHMCALGLMQPAFIGEALLFRPTFLAALLVGGGAAQAPAAAAAAGVGGFIVVETTFRVYAYTSSPVQVQHWPTWSCSVAFSQ